MSSTKKSKTTSISADGMTLEEYLQQYYGLKGPLYRKRPWYDRENCPHWWTMKGVEAYGRFTDSLFNLEKFARTEIHGCTPLNFKDVNRLISVLDEFEYEDPRNG